MGSLKVFIIRRLISMFITFIAIVSLVFVLVRCLTDPFELLVFEDPRITEEVIRELKAAFGLDKPLWEQYVIFIYNLFRGELGYSLHEQRPVIEVIMDRLPWTLALLIPAIVISTLLAIYVGMKTAWHHGTRYDIAVTGVALFIRSMPHFWLAMLFLMYFAYQLGWFPLYGAYTYGATYSNVFEFIKDVLWHMALPLSVLVVREVGMYMLYMRNSMIEVLGEDFVWLAKAKGLDERRVMYRHAARVAMLPMVTITAIRFGLMVNGVVLTETVFSYPGMGRLIFEAIMNSDYFLIQGAFFITAICVLVANFIGDLIIAYLDPRIRLR